MPSSLNGTGVTFNDGTQLNSRNEAGGNFIQQTFTGPTTWTKPAGLKAVKVTVIGGGGGGGGCRNIPGTYGNFGNSGACGGGGGGAIRFLPAASIPGPVVVTVGAGGAAGGSPGGSGAVTTGGAGGASSFGSFLSATGGAGAPNAGIGNDPPGPNPTEHVLAAGGVGSGGNINVAGGFGVRASVSNRANVALNRMRLETFGGAGAIFSQLNSRPTATGNGIAGQHFGQGGTGANIRANQPAQGRAGGAGATGVIVVEEFF